MWSFKSLDLLLISPQMLHLNSFFFFAGLEGGRGCSPEEPGTGSGCSGPSSPLFVGVDAPAYSVWRSEQSSMKFLSFLKILNRFLDFLRENVFHKWFCQIKYLLGKETHVSQLEFIVFIMRYQSGRHIVVLVVVTNNNTNSLFIEVFQISLKEDHFISTFICCCKFLKTFRLPAWTYYSNSCLKQSKTALLKFVVLHLNFEYWIRYG